ncbi:MAG: UbiA family prenyltransferase [Bacteroidetes bacterium]|nr:UbiA family prenyltransferase [Bacteroidota bacterium]
MHSPRIASAQRLFVVDLDGTLVATDTLWESLLLLRQHPRRALSLPRWLGLGKTGFKVRMADTVVPDPAALPYRAEVHALIAEARAAGDVIVLATAADQRIAEAVADYMGGFDAVLATDATTNLSGSAKKAAIEKLAAGRPFAYAGDALVDVPIFQAADRAMLVAPSSSTRRTVQAACPQVEVVAEQPSTLRSALRALRMHQWAKNLLVAVPLLTAMHGSSAAGWLRVAVAFVAFSFVASSVYLVNDLLDVASDRAHPRKRSRPIASGSLSIPAALGLAAVLLAAGLGMGAALGTGFFVVLTIYYGLTTAYSLHLKRLALVDVLTLAALYGLRIVAGAVAVGVPLSLWLLSFSTFLFFSLALVKRYTELLDAEASGRTVAGRGYTAADRPLVGTVGVGAALMAVLVLALYVSSEHVRGLYAQPAWLWGAFPLLLFWTTRIWMLTYRGQMHDDPIVFALRDRTSLTVATLVAVLALMARFGEAWGLPPLPLTW